ncbi:hypothetical protein X564_12970 [Pseudoalteromonas agarivorans]|nr:hypothetical protein X564_12970 [Pseudoalteromonas agarivorans]
MPILLFAGKQFIFIYGKILRQYLFGCLIIG